MAERQNGRIGGGVLRDNLLRQGVDLAFETDLLYLKVSPEVIGTDPLEDGDPNQDAVDKGSIATGIGINTNAPSDPLTLVSRFKTENLVADTLANIGNFEIQNSEINQLSNSIQLSAGVNIFATAIATDDLKFDFNTISTTTPNTNIELRPNGEGVLNIRSNWNITGSLYATGDITFGGNLTLGDSNQDNVDFEADINSDLIPDIAGIYNLGSNKKKWGNVYVREGKVDSIVVDDYVIDGVSLALRQGNTFYVSELGNDFNVGDHQNGAFRTLKHALEMSDSSLQGPVTIHIFPGEYEEEFPLTVPPHVTIKGEDIRNVIIKPTVATQDQDAFLIEGDVTIEDLTIKDFYYNNVTNTGHALRFKPNGVVSTRSPYIRNITVITKGSVTTADDPRGFNTGDAGKGALIDGAELDGDSLEASMLFHSVTFITPGVDAITMTNGVRVEWLNSFTYFANRGLYATQGDDGKIMPDSTKRYGAEIRSIGSACVYGNFGAVADGPNTLMYLIGHNFAYIGLGKDVTNDSTLVTQDNEVVELNFGKIYYNSTDALGTYRVGDNFFVDFETGTTSIDANSVAFDGVSSILVNDAGVITYIDGEKIETGNIRITENTITNVITDLELTPYTGVLHIESNPGFVVSKGQDADRTDVEGSIRYNTETNLFEGYSTGNLAFGGIYSDDRQESISADKNNNELLFRAAGTLVGSVNSASLVLHGLSSEDILFDNNLITTTLSNSDLELYRSGNAVVRIDDVDINDKTISNTSDNTLTLQTTGDGYVKFDSTTGLVIPFGSTAARPVTPEIGDTRWNTDDQILETYNGTEYQRSAGTGEEVTDEILKDLVDIYTLVLG